MPEDLNLIQHVKTTLMDVVKHICSEKHSYTFYDADYDDYCTDRKATENVHEIVDTITSSRLYPSGEDIKSDKDKQNESHPNVLEDITAGSPDDCSNDCCYHAEESIMPGTASPFQNWHLIDDDISQSLQDSTTFHECLYQNFDSQEEPNLPSDGENVGTLYLETFQDWGPSKIISDTHDGPLSVIQENTNHFITDQNNTVCGQRSSFLNWSYWRKDFMVHGSTTQASQKTLKTILFKVPLMHAHSTSESLNKEGSSVDPLKPQACHSYISHSTSEERADNGMLCALDRQTDSGQNLVLKSMLPSVAKVLTHSLYIPITRSLTKIKAQGKEGEGDILYFRFSDLQLILALMAFQTDETSILMDTIEYLKELEARVDELESCIDFEGSSAMRDLELDLVEHTSDNYEGVEDEKQPLMRKRKASEIYETDTDLGKAIQKDIQPLDVKVDIAADEVLMRVICPWREHLLLDIMEAANDLNLDTHTVQSSTLNGILSLFLKSKVCTNE